jgi:hypothetical protein
VAFGARTISAAEWLRNGTGEFAASLVKDDRIAKGPKLTIEVSDFSSDLLTNFAICEEATP